MEFQENKSNVNTVNTNQLYVFPNRIKESTLKKFKINHINNSQISEKSAHETRLHSSNSTASNLVISKKDIQSPDLCIQARDFSDNFNNSQDNNNDRKMRSYINTATINLTKNSKGSIINKSVFVSSANMTNNNRKSQFSPTMKKEYEANLNDSKIEKIDKQDKIEKIDLKQKKITKKVSPMKENNNINKINKIKIQEKNIKNLNTFNKPVCSSNNKNTFLGHYPLNQQEAPFTLKKQQLSAQNQTLNNPVNSKDSNFNGEPSATPYSTTTNDTKDYGEININLSKTPNYSNNNTIQDTSNLKNNDIVGNCRILSSVNSSQNIVKNKIDLKKYEGPLNNINKKLDIKALKAMQDIQGTTNNINIQNMNITLYQNPDNNLNYKEIKGLNFGSLIADIKNNNKKRNSVNSNDDPKSNINDVNNRASSIISNYSNNKDNNLIKGTSVMSNNKQDISSYVSLITNLNKDIAICKTPEPETLKNDENDQLSDKKQPPVSKFDVLKKNLNINTSKISPKLILMNSNAGSSLGLGLVKDFKKDSDFKKNTEGTNIKQMNQFKLETSNIKSELEEKKNEAKPNHLNKIDYSILNSTKSHHNTSDLNNSKQRDKKLQQNPKSISEKHFLDSIEFSKTGINNLSGIHNSSGSIKKYSETGSIISEGDLFENYCKNFYLAKTGSKNANNSSYSSNNNTLSKKIKDTTIYTLTDEGSDELLDLPDVRLQHDSQESFTKFYKEMNMKLFNK